MSYKHLQPDPQTFCEIGMSLALNCQYEDI